MKDSNTPDLENLTTYLKLILETELELEKSNRIRRLQRLLDQCNSFEAHLNELRAEQFVKELAQQTDNVLKQLDDETRWEFGHLMNAVEAITENMHSAFKEQETTIKEMEVAIVRLESAVSQFELEVRHWRFFFQESRRLFGEKQGKFGELIDKAHNILRENCAIHAYSTPESQERNESIEKMFPEQSAYYRKKMDAAMQKKFSMSRDPDPILMRYRYLTGYPRHKATPEDLARRQEEEARWGAFWDKRRAIEIIAAEYKFPTWRAAFDFLKRQGQKNLPADYPEV